jgi:hypothetical protein
MFKKFSYGVTIVSEREIELVTFQFRTLKKFINLDDLEIIVNTSLSRQTFPFKTDRVIYQKQLQPSKFCNDFSSGQAGQDCANRLDFIVKEAHGDFVILTHSDIAWVGNVINGITNEISNLSIVGIIENWRWGMTIISKEFYNLSSFGFFRIPNICVFREYNGQLRIIPPSGPFSNRVESEKKEHVLGLDMGELLELDCYNKGYQHILLKDNKYYKHIGEQSLAWWNDNYTEEQKQAKLCNLDLRKNNFFREYGG